MEERERAERDAVIQEARTWTNTPFVWDGQNRGKTGGVDCGRFVGSVFNGTGIKHVDLSRRNTDLGLDPQWFMHKGGGTYLDFFKKYAIEYELLPGQRPQPGDVVVAEYGRDWAHAAIVVEWPRVIAAIFKGTVGEWKNIHLSPQFQGRKLKYFNPWAPGAPDGRE